MQTTPGSLGTVRNWFNQFGRFALVGISNTIVDFVVYLALTRGVQYFTEHFLLANLIAFLVANLNSYLWNRFYTFTGSEAGLRRYPVFLTVSAIYLGVIQLGMWYLVGRLGFYDVLAKVLVVGCATVVYFTVLRQWVFRSRVYKATERDASEVPAH